MTEVDTQEMKHFEIEHELESFIKNLVVSNLVVECPGCYKHYS